MKLIDIIKKDVLVVLRDFKALVFILIMPIVLIVILSLALGSVFQSDNGFTIGQINIAVVDNADDSEFAVFEEQLSEYSDASFDVEAMSLYSVLDVDEIKEFINYEVMDEAKAKNLLEDNEIDAIVTIPKGYTEQLLLAMFGGGGGVEIDVLGAQQSTLEATIVSSIVQSYADTLSSVSADMDILVETIKENGALSQQTIDRVNIESFIQNAVTASVSSTIDINSKGVEARKVLNSFYYYSIAITCMFILYSAGQGSSFLYTESEEKTLQRLTAAGISKKKLLFGKSVAVFCLCMIQLIILFAFSTFAFGIEWGNPLVFVAISICVAISVTGLGVLLMVLVYRAGNPSIGNVFQSVIVQVLALFGGSYLPLSTLPKFFSTISLFTPNGLAIKAYTENVTGAPFAEVLPYLAGSVALGVVLYFVGVVLFPRERRA